MDTNQVRICVPVCVNSVRELAPGMARAATAGDLVEIRFDCLESSELEQGLKQVADQMDSLNRSLIITFRPAEQGGRRALDRDSRFLFWTSKFWAFNKPRSADFYDIEVDLALGIASTDFYQGSVNWQTVICSHHDFVGIPDDLDKIYERMVSTPARILKIALHADDITDCIPIFRLLDRARREGREMIAIGMGTAGIVTRILGPSRGAFLTYGALETQSTTAPGQLTAEELRGLYRIDHINLQTQITGLVGLPVGHSVSPHIQNAAFAAAGVNGVYIPFEVRDVSAFIKRMVHPRTREIDWNLGGLSVTAPHKTAVIDHLDWIEPSAKEIGAVNTIVISDDVLLGYNTDATAVLKPVIEKLGPLRDARCAIIGAGGAASAALWGLRQEGAELTVFARKTEKAEVLAERFGAAWETLGEASFDGFDVVINTTPLGTVGQFETATPATARQLRGARWAYDLVYNPTETLFLREAKEAGGETLGGLPMLIAQAAEQFRLWTGADASEGVMYEAAEQALHLVRSGEDA